MTKRELQIETTIREWLRNCGFYVEQDGDVFAFTARNQMNGGPAANAKVVNVSGLAREIGRTLG